MKAIHKKIFLLLVFSAAALYLFTLNSNYIGMYNDDASYVNIARSFAGVEDRQEPLYGRPLGYPLLMAPVAKLFPESITALRMLSLFFMLAIPFMLFFRMDDLMEPGGLLLLTAMVCFSRFSVTASGDIMAEAAYLFFTFISLLLLKGYLKVPRGMRAVFTALPVVVMAYIKTQGFLMFAAIAIFLILIKKYRDTFFFAVTFLILALPLLIPGSQAGSSAAEYMGEIWSTYIYGESSIFKLLAGTAGYYFRYGIYSGLMGVHDEWGVGFLMWKPISVSVSAAVLFLISAGMLKVREPAYMRAVKIYVVLYAMLHMLWVNVSVRYIIPVFPFLLYFMMRGIKELAGRKALYAVSGLILFLYACDAAKLIENNLKRDTGLPWRPLETMEWISENTSGDSIIYSNYASRLRFNTGRLSPGFNFISRDDFYAKLLIGGFDYVAPLSMRFTQRTFQYSLPITYYKMIMWYLADPTRYIKVYSNDKEDAAVWQVRQSTSFLKAFDLNNTGLDHYNSGELDAAWDYFDKALDMYPDMPTATTNITKIYLKKKEYANALKTLDSAIRVYPASDILFAFRGWTYMMMNEYGPALKNLEEALRISDYHGRVQFARLIKEDIRGLQERMQVLPGNADGTEKQ